MANCKKQYLLNTNSKKVHDTKRADKRCKLDLMKPECKVYFETLEAALSWPNAETPLAKKCRFCLGD